MGNLFFAKSLACFTNPSRELQQGTSIIRTLIDCMLAESIRATNFSRYRSLLLSSLGHAMANFLPFNTFDLKSDETKAEQSAAINKSACLNRGFWGLIRCS